MNQVSKYMNSNNLSKRERQKIADKKYRNSPHGKAKLIEDRKTAERKGYMKNYHISTGQKSKQKIYRETERARSLRGIRETPERKRQWLLNKYNLTVEDYNLLLEKQNNLCAICGGISNGRWNCLFVDHCHKTGRVRGLLCFKCNTAIGMLDDNTDSLNRAIEYLK